MKALQEIQIGKIKLSKQIDCEGSPYIFLSNDGEGMGFNGDLQVELEELLKQLLYKYF